MAFISVRCPYCQSEHVIKGGKTDTGKQRYRCHNPDCSHQSFVLNSAYKGRSPQIKQQVIDLSLNGSGVLDTARVLGISPTTVLNELKKKGFALPCEPAPDRTPAPEPRVEVVLARVDAAEVDEMWSFVGKKQEPRWLWHAIDHHTGKVLAYVFGRRKHEVFVKLQMLLEPFGLTRYYTAYGGAYGRNLAPAVHSPGKRHTQQIERKHLTLRTRIKRLVRKTICFSKSILMHDIVIGLFLNRYEFGLPV